ncbi:MotE family protein [Thalassococcus sp. BH17M4-6]|uniref:MotE family protein n=1 Tax=Thalassococcus sp. BH17M4-6 TaxID=3413148 RepID=UPI003BD74FF7
MRGLRKSGAGHRRGRGSLALIGGLLIGSALVRIGSETGQALAEEHGGPASADTAAHAPAMATTEAELLPMLEALKSREARLEKRENDLRVRIQALSVAEEEIDRKLEAMATAEDKLRATLALAQTAAEDDLTRLTDVYANMKPKQAAALFEQMDPEFAAGFLGRMRADAAAAIMAGLSPQAAYTVSVVLAGRNADVPKE